MTDGSDSTDIPNADPDLTAPELTAPELTAQEQAAQAIELLQRLKLEHRRIDQEINALAETGVADMLKVKRMKKIKLSIKDQIAYLENQVTPDIIA